MKKLYTSAGQNLLSFCTGLLCLPGGLFAQCSCAGGAAPNVVTYTAAISTTNLPVSYVSFPQFNPATGTLTCVSLLDTISGTTTTGVRNLASVKVRYRFQLTVSNNISGPGGLGSSQSFSTFYGPDSLGAYGTATDTITYGPDPLFTNATDSNNTTAVADYLGNGTVTFSYGISGGLVTLEGGLNYRNQIITVYQGNFRLNYYWCPASLLAGSIVGFTVRNRGDDIILQWAGENEQEGNGYEIQYSPDGIHFTTITTLKAKSSGSSSESSYQYRYTPGRQAGEHMYFRLKKTGASGIAGYSAIKMVVTGRAGTAGFLAYPNPASKHITLEPPGPLTGNFIISVVNPVGQVMYSKTLAANGAASLQFDLPPGLQRGLYYLELYRPVSRDKQMVKLMVQ